MTDSRAVNFPKNDANRAAGLIIFLSARGRFRVIPLFTNLFTVAAVFFVYCLIVFTAVILLCQTHLLY